MTVNDLIDSGIFTLVNTGDFPETPISKIFCCDLLSIAMSRASAGCAWVTVMGNMNTLAVASLSDAACVILASKGYPGSYEKGYPITIPADLEAEVYIAGAKEQDGQLVSSGGRVLGVTAVAPTLSEALERAYAAADRIEFQNAYCRRDIGRRALAAKEG